MFLITAFTEHDGIKRSWVAAALSDKEDVERVLESIPDELRNNYDVSGIPLEFPFYVLILQNGEAVQSVDSAWLKALALDYKNKKDGPVPVAYRITEDYQSSDILQDNMAYDLLCVEFDEEFYKRREVKMWLSEEVATDQQPSEVS